MSKTAGCVFALGVCMVLAAACGDDDGGPATGGNGGAAGGAGMGSGGRAGAAGAPIGGSGGTPSGGVGGAPAGAGGESGNGGVAGDGSEPPDAGSPDATAPEAGAPVGTCPNFADSAADLLPQDGQEVAIARVLFSGNTASVVIRNIQDAVPGDAGLTVFKQLNAPGQLCSGPTNCQFLEDICVEAGDDLDLFAGEEAVCTINGTSAVEGELAVISNEASVAAAFVFAYVAWDLSGGFTSPLPPQLGGDAGVATSLEDRAVDRDGDPFWTDGDRISMSPGDNTIVGIEDVIAADGFTSCRR